MHILIVDDEVYIRELVAKYLKHENYESSFACNGKEAVEMIKICIVIPPTKIYSLFIITYFNLFYLIFN